MSAAHASSPPSCAVLFLSPSSPSLPRPRRVRRSAVLAGGHPGRLPQGRPRTARGRRARPADPRADHHARVRRRACPSCGPRCPDPAGVVFLGTGNDGKVFRVDASGRGTLFYDAPGAAGPRRAAAARRLGARRHLARRARLPRRRCGHGDASSSIPTRSTSGRWPPTPPAGSTSPPAIPRAASTAWPPMAPARRSTRRVPRHVVSMAFDAERRLVVGTESPGRVFRLDAEGRPVPAARHQPAGGAGPAPRRARPALRGRPGAPQRRRRGRRRHARPCPSRPAGHAGGRP